MTPSVVALLGLPLVAAVGLGDDTALLQQTSGTALTSGPEDSVADALPLSILGESNHPASAALLGTEKVAGEMEQSIEVLQKRLGEMHSNEKRNLEAQDTMYKKKLEAQKLENEVVRNTNAMITENIAVLTKHNAEKRASCKRVMEANDVLRSNLTSLKKDILLATDFVNTSEAEYAVANLNVPELQVLTQLDEADHRSAGTKQSNLAPRLSMLDRGQARPHHESPAEQLLKGLSESLEKLGEEEKDGAAKLRAHFMEVYKAQALDQTNLRNEQVKLNATKVSLTHLEDRLDKALTHLGSVHKQLSDRLSSALKFTWTMHSRHLPEEARSDVTQAATTPLTPEQDRHLDGVIDKALEETKASLQ